MIPIGSLLVVFNLVTIQAFFFQIKIFWSQFKAERDCKRNIRKPSMQRWQCPIHIGTLETFIWLIMWKILSFFLGLNNAYHPFKQNYHWDLDSDVFLERNELQGLEGESVYSSQVRLKLITIGHFNYLKFSYFSNVLTSLIIEFLNFTEVSIKTIIYF